MLISHPKIYTFVHDHIILFTFHAPYKRNHMQEDRLTYASKFIYIAPAYVCMVHIYYKNVFFHLNGQEME